MNDCGQYTSAAEAIAAYAAAELDTIADHGPEIWERGGYADVANSVFENCTRKVQAELAHPSRLHG